MKLIRLLSDYIEEEIGDAHKYAQKALELKHEYPDTSKLFYTLSTEELDHANRLHKVVVNLIETYRSEKGEPPKEMMFVYDYLHKKQIDRTAEVKNLQAMYRE